MLTDTKLRNLKPKDKLYKVNDRDGLYVAVTAAGAISFRYNYSIHGRQETIKLVFHVFAALAEFERGLIRERAQAGLAAARARGRAGGRRPKLDEQQVREIKVLLRDPGIQVADVGSMPFCVELDNLKDTDAPIHQPAAMLVAAD